MKPDLKRRLREHLSRLFSESRAGRIFVSDVGLDPGRIDFSGSASIVWFNILEEADKSGRLVDLVEAAVQQYPKNRELLELRDELSQPLDPPDVSVPVSAASTGRTVDFLCTYDVADQAEAERIAGEFALPPSKLTPPDAEVEVRVENQDAALGWTGRLPSSMTVSDVIRRVLHEACLQVPRDCRTWLVLYEDVGEHTPKLFATLDELVTGRNCRPPLVFNLRWQSRVYRN